MFLYLLYPPRMDFRPFRSLWRETSLLQIYFSLLPLSLPYSNKSVGVILPPSVGPIGRPRKEWNLQLKTINAVVVAGLNSTVVWNIEPTGIGVMAASPTRPFGVPVVVNSAWVISQFLNYPQHSCITITSVFPDAYINCSSLLLHLQGWPI
jgi:hypothetical protein